MPPLPQGDALSLPLPNTDSLSHTERRRDRNSKNLIVRRDAGFRSGNRRKREREREREREKKGEIQTGSQSQGEGGKKEESLYLMVGGQRANTSPEPLGGRRSLYRSYSLHISLSMPLCF